VGPSLFEFVLLATTLLTVAVLLRRLRVVEEERTRLRSELDRRGPHDDEQDAMIAMGMLTNELCHLLVSPLTVILAQCELARSGGEMTRRLETIERQARRIADVVERHRTMAGGKASDTQRVDPVECALAAKRAVATLAADRGVAVHEILDDVQAIEANPVLLKHALRQVLRAAVEASPRDMGDVTLAVGVLPIDGEPTHVAFAVADDGPGIDLLQLPRIFHPFPEDVGSMRSEGYAYAVAYAIARAMGANLVIDTAPGHGTRATLKLPLAKPEVRSGPRAGIEVARSE